MEVDITLIQESIENMDVDIDVDGNFYTLIQTCTIIMLHCYRFLDDNMDTEDDIDGNF